MFATKQLENNFYYKVRSRGFYNWREYDTVRMEISVGQDYHEGMKLEAACDWAEKNFKRTVFIVGDTVQRHNHIISGMPEEQSYEKAKADGDAWLDRNARTLSRKTFEITRWDEWKNAEKYEQVRQSCDTLLETHSGFRSELQKCIDETFSRRKLPLSQKPDFEEKSKLYLLEETAVFSFVFEEIKGISAYPGSFMGLWTMFVDNNISDAPEGLKYGHWTRLSFEKRPTYFDATSV